MFAFDIITDMSTVSTQKQAARQFVREWSGKGYEKGETQRFWIDLLHTVFDIDNLTKMMAFEVQLKTLTKEKGADFIDDPISTNKILIKQKGSHIDLNAKARQSDGAELTPYQQIHRANDTAVLRAYGFPKNATESDIVVRIFKMYQELTNK